jgi:hypothetical protein
VCDKGDIQSENILFLNKKNKPLSDDRKSLLKNKDLNLSTNESVYAPALKPEVLELNRNYSEKSGIEKKEGICGIFLCCSKSS